MTTPRHQQYNDPNHSVASSTHSATAAVDLDDEQTAIKNTLRGLCFTGCYVDTNWIESLRSYRDAVRVRAATEPHFVATLEYVRTKLLHRHRHAESLAPFGDASPPWIGATVDATPPGSSAAEQHGDAAVADAMAAGQRPTMRRAAATSIDALSWTLWTELPEGTALGEHRFKVKTIRWRPNEVMIKLRLADNDNDVDPSDSTNTSTSSWWQPAHDTSRPHADVDAWQLAHELIDAAVDRAAPIARHSITLACLGWWQLVAWLQSCEFSWRRTADAIQYAASVLLLLAVLVLRLAAALGYWTLVLVVEARKWWTVSVPVVQQLIDLVRTVIGATFYLVAMIWRDLIGAGGQRSEAMPPLPAVQWRKSPTPSPVWQRRQRRW